MHVPYLIPRPKYRPMQSLEEFQRARAKFWEQRPEERARGAESRFALIEEESNEALDELDRIANGSPLASLEKLAKELADVLYVTYGTAEYFGIPLEQVFQEVHRSNLTKLDADGVPHEIVRATGKFAKGEHYVPPDVHGVLTGHWV